ncbi:MAG: response regulator, partial [Nitrospirales bacterium]|nr:response regulator [Nitrospirales bacterium]
MSSDHGQLPIRVLLIEDSPADAFLTTELLSEPLSIVWAATLKKGVQLLSEGGIDVVLLDLSLPDSRGLDTLKQ